MIEPKEGLGRVRKALEAGAPPDQDSPGLKWARKVEVIDEITIGVKGKTVYTVGHSAHGWEGFLELLRPFAITFIVDVRRTPYSRARPHFSRQWLEDDLPRAGIGYARIDGLYEGRDHPGFERGLALLAKKVANEPAVCLMCVEEDPAGCHRKTVIAAELHKLHIAVKHIRPRIAP